MDVLEVAHEIEKLIKAIRDEGKRSQDLIQAKASAMMNYDKAIAVRSVIHKADGMAVTMIKEQAKGDASQLLYDMIVATETLKAHWERLKYLQAQLNGCQSINRFLAVT